MQQTIIITGASSGFGLATAELLAAKGHRVYGLCRRPMEHGKIHYMQCDVRNREQVAEVVGRIAQEAGRIDVLVNNAGMGIGGALELATPEEIDLQMGTNFMGCVNLCQAVLPYMRKQRSGKIVNLSSIGGVMGLPWQGFYSASKFAIEGFSEALAAEVRSFGIRVAMVEPGDFATGFTASRRHRQPPQQPGHPRRPRLRPPLPPLPGHHREGGELRSEARRAGVPHSPHRGAEEPLAAPRRGQPRAMGLRGRQACALRQPDGGHPPQLLQVLTTPSPYRNAPPR